MAEVLDAPIASPKVARVQNYKLIKGEFGAYKPGSVLPEFALRQAGDIDEMIKRRKFEPTNEAVNVNLAPPRVSAAPDVTKDVYDENTTLRGERDRLKEENSRLDSFIKATASREADIKNSLAEHIAENGHLKRVLVQKDEEIADLKKQNAAVALELQSVRQDLEAATAPAKPTEDKTKTAKK